jgi:hypothetical protein
MTFTAEELRLMTELEKRERIFANSPDRGGVGRLIDAGVVELRRLDDVLSILTLTTLGLGYLRATVKAKELSDR